MSLLGLLVLILLVTGTFFMLVAGIGVVRMPDLYLRMSATTKAATLGAGCILVAAGAHFQTLGVISRVGAIVIFLLITAPIAAHLLGRAAYFDGVPFWDGTLVDEFKARQRERLAEKE
jgi:multicomponent Na+:H+ antiporter subunit G